MDFFCSFFFNVDINDERQRTFILGICSKILSHPFRITNSSLHLETYNFHVHNCFNQFEIDKLLQEAFQSNNVYVYRSYSSIYVDFKIDTLNNVLPICKQWFQPSIKSLVRLDEEKRRLWNQNFNGNHSEEIMKNDLINNIDIILPGFNYLIDFEWKANESYYHYGVGDLIFGSDYGVYIVIETKWLNMNSGKSVARNHARNEVKTQAKRYRQFAQEKFTVKVIGSSYTNDTVNNAIQFVDSQDEEIAKFITNYYNGSVLWDLILTIIWFPVELVKFVCLILLYTIVVFIPPILFIAFIIWKYPHLLML
ncbi:hypothetical protein C1645_866802 [Glomus cerebriforme]|uniref:Uncharacterized protein n=1 Tax=Glomus cerebriforme TaxID=658196 RepID=A0A397S210_9GLOM|nr:hypothetical protein C1645_866802 [Glomus cerebriforme]